MTIRNRTADWISGGALTEARNDAAHAIFERQELARECRILRIQSDQAAIRGAALRRIAAMETPGANATVKRMAQAAREALK